ncbi:MAG: TRAP transporter small permease subunit [Pseudomonadota bacterium]
MEKPEELISISDPGERGRSEHNVGDRLMVHVSNVFSWIYPILMLVIVIQVFLRSFGRMDVGPGNQAWLDDMQWWLYGLAVLIGVGYAVTTNSHVRVDIFHDNFSKERKARIEVFALAWLFLPFIILAWDLTFHYAVASVVSREGSDSPNGLHRLYLLKIAMNLTFVLIGMAIWAAYRRNLAHFKAPTLFNQLLYALPSVMFLINLAIFYVLYWFVRMTAGPDLRPNRITREPIFDYFMVEDADGKMTEFTLLNIPIAKTVVMTIVVMALVLIVARLFAHKTEKDA